ncbi:Hsp70 family protein [Solwaraspora sp. WMMD406]|uniref:Hsp70 family protein n=1 Tax=Solwaraspora sp. WMMD406 TaxID=3016095 RepID=UPI002415A066|nr:Hsp70 family protein [Solwaraspora sp. WMMD406]MDG4767542.1 Hsp70 family protein [Solwaraspora sp. WMMD406]
MSGMSDQPVLVVDFGTTSSAAAVVVGETSHLVPDPVTGAATWPSAVHWDGESMIVGALAERRKRSEPTAYATEFKRGMAADVPMVLGDRRFRPIEQVAAVLTALRAEAERRYGAPVRRTVVTIPASYGPDDPRRAQMIAAAEAAGLGPVELLPEPVAAAFAPVAGPPPVPGELVLVYDLGGGTFDTALVRIDERWHEVLGHSAIDDCGGRDIDSLLANRIHSDGQQWLAPLLVSAANSQSAPATLRLGMAVTDFAKRIKHQLSDTPTVEDFLLPDTPAYRLTRAELAELAAPLLDRTIACCRQLLDELGVPPAGLGSVLLVGGGARMPAVAEAVHHAFGRPLRQVEEPELATVLGAARWLPRSGPRTIRASTDTSQMVPLSFVLPGGWAQLLRWLIVPGQPYPAGTPLARVRLAGGTLWDLVAATPGTIDRLLVPPGSEVASHQWLALSTS